MSGDGLLRLGVLIAGLALLFLGAHRLQDRAPRFVPFLMRRTAWTVLVLLLVFGASFLLMRAVPGGPFDGERELPPEIRQALLERYQLDRPLLEQFGLSLEALLRFDLGPSMTLRDGRVRDVIAQGLPSTLVLGLLALTLAAVVGTLTGMAAAARRGRPLDRLLMILATTGMALPGFVLAGLLLIPLAFWWRLLPPAGWGRPIELVLPVFCLASPFAAQIARLARTGFLEVLNSDWIRTARAKGLSERQVLFRHALRGACGPTVTFLGPAAAGILTGSLVIEEIFAIPGVGSHFVQAALARDYTLSMGMILLYTALLSAMNTLADLALALLDPRVELR